MLQAGTSASSSFEVALHTTTIEFTEEDTLEDPKRSADDTRQDPNAGSG